jgi:hypothetical protein
MDTQEVIDIFQEEQLDQEEVMTSMNDFLLYKATKRTLDAEKAEAIIKKPRSMIYRKRQRAHVQLCEDYFNEDCTYTEDQYRRRFRISEDVFFRILDAVQEKDGYFKQKTDAARRPGFSALQKISVAIRLLAYGVSADSLDESFRMAESTSLECLKRFCSAVVSIFSDEYLRAPNAEDIKRLLREGESRGFPGMLGSLDCMHWEWKNCPTAWHGQFVGKEKTPTIILEAVASYDMWIWHAFFGMPGSLNDINVLDRSHLFKDLANGEGPVVNFSVNGNQYNMGYYLTDGIYPAYASFVKSFSNPQTPKEKV